jgi:hypothetical protein
MDPEGPQYSTNIEKKWRNLIFSAGCSLLRACTILTSWRLKDKYIVIFDEKKFKLSQM